MPSSSLSLTTPDTVIYDLKSVDRTSAFAEMVEDLFRLRLVPADLKNVVIEALENREKSMSTAIGRELAIPHAAIKGLPQVVRMMARSEVGIDCAARDGLPVRFFYLSLIPDNDYSTHLRTIAAVSSFFHRPDSLERIKQCKNAEELRSVFSE
ncbi:MAG: PTS sugar transporter subunit IIA [Candidatus Methylacidiphilales bacterium]